MNDKKGMIASIPGEPVGMQDANARPLTHGFHLKVTGVRSVQPDPSKMSYKEASVLVVKSARDHSLEKCTIKVPLKRLCHDFPAVLREDIGATPVRNLDAALKANRESVGISFEEDDKYDSLLTLVFAASVGDAAQCAPTYTTASWLEPDGWYVRGKKVLSTPVEVSRELRDPESNAVLYVLRAPRLTGEGWEYSKPITWAEFLAGSYKFSDGRSINVIDSTQAFMAMTERWDGLSHSDKLKQEREQWEQPQKDIETIRRRAFGFRDWESR
jgi:hypothetical protein